MSPYSVAGDRLTFGVDDPSAGIRRLQLDCDDAVPGPRRFRRTRDGWVLPMPLPDLQRLEYRLVVTATNGDSAVVLDPDNPERVRTAFGDRSVALLPGYEAPAWLAASAPPGERHDRIVQTGVGDLPVSVWVPDALDAGTPAPLLVAHDGPEMAELAGLDRFAAAQIATGALPPFRMLLCQPTRRDEWYSANPDYLDAESHAIGEVAADFAIDPARVVVMGASLGGLAAVMLAVSDRLPVAGVLSQSGSFFQPRLDPQESSYPWFDQVARGVEVLVGDAAAHAPMPVAMTCGALEENLANNVALADRLRAAGHDVSLTQVRDVHNYTAWRDAWDPALIDLLRRCFG